MWFDSQLTVLGPYIAYTIIIWVFTRYSTRNVVYTSRPLVLRRPAATLAHSLRSLALDVVWSLLDLNLLFSIWAAQNSPHLEHSHVKTRHRSRPNIIRVGIIDYQTGHYLAGHHCLPLCLRYLPTNLFNHIERDVCVDCVIIKLYSSLEQNGSSIKFVLFVLSSFIATKIKTGPSRRDKIRNSLK